MSSTKKKKILIADDNDSILEVIEIVLAEENYNVHTVADGAMVVNYVDKIRPDLILLDIWMSGHDGRDIIKTLRSHKELSSIPIILISANNETRQIAQQSGANDFIAKPFDIEDLLSIIKKHTS